MQHMRPPPAVSCSGAIAISKYMLAIASGTASLVLLEPVKVCVLCKISNIIFFISLQIRLETAKTLPPNTSLILQVMANSLKAGTAEPSRF